MLGFDDREDHLIARNILMFLGVVLVIKITGI